jgi:hypothetical protein
MKYIYFLFFFGLSWNLHAQPTTQVENKSNKHEVKLDGFEAFVTPALELNYEYSLDQRQSLGGYIHFNFNQEVNQIYQEKFLVGFLYRNYIYNRPCKTKNAGLFLEGVNQLALGDHHRFINLSDYENIGNWQNIGIGASIGYKWLSSYKLVVEVLIGGGFYIFNTKRSPDGFFRGGILMGYRF